MPKNLTKICFRGKIFQKLAVTERKKLNLN